MPAKPPKGADVEKKDVEKVVEQTDVYEKDIKQVFRVISLTGQFMEGFPVEPVDVINDYLRSIMSDGYTLMHIQHLRTERSKDDTPVGEQMLYVFVKQ